MQIPAHSIAILPKKLIGKCIITIQCILEVEIDDLVSIQNSQKMLQAVSLKDEIKPAQVSLTRCTARCKCLTLDH